MKNDRPGRFRRPQAHQCGQAMIEYIVVTAFGLMILLGPGVDLLREELPKVMRDNHRGYSYAISLSSLPPYGTGEAYRIAMAAEGIDQATIDALGVDPIEDAMLEQIQQYLDFKEQITSIIDEYSDFDIEDIWDEAEDEAFSFFDL